MRAAQAPLPIDPVLPELVAALRDVGMAVLCAPPGAGKTTRVPPAILDAGLLPPSHPNLVMLQPRRVAARAAATRIAQERGCRVGDEVGYHVRLERRIGPGTRIQIMTEGLLTRRLIDAPFLEGVGAVVLDEFHERSIHADLAVALLKEVRDSVRPDLLLVVMSATLDAGPIAAYLGGAPIIQAPGRAYPVAIDYLGDAERRPIAERVRNALELVLADEPDRGDVLVFLPGMEEIRRSQRALAGLEARHGLVVLPLHGGLSAAEQDRALAPASGRKVVLATNVAETSLTIEGVRTVIDSGLARYASHDPARGLDRLELGRISRASATQRAGRAGRTGPGRCVRLWSARDERGMPEFDEPDVRRVDLCETMLALHSWGHSDPMAFDWFEAPPAAAVAGAELLLTRLGALDPQTRRTTELGHALLGLPVHPRLGRLALAARDAGLPREGAALAALLSERDILQFGPEGRSRFDSSGSRNASSSDLLVRMDLLDAMEATRFTASWRERGACPVTARRVAHVRDDLYRRVVRVRRAPIDEPRFEGQDTDAPLLHALLLAYPDRVARRRGPDEPVGRLVGGRGVRLEPASVVRDAEFFLAIEARDQRRGGKREALVRLASAIRPEWLEAWFPEAVQRVRSACYDPETRRIVGLVEVLYHDLPIQRSPHAAVEPDEAARVLAEALALEAEAIIRSSGPARAWLDRVACLRAWRPDLALPDCGGDLLSAVFREGCQGCRSVDDLEAVPWLELLRAAIGHRLARLVEDAAPEALTVPSGNRIRLQYEPGRPPVLAVRLQELFGWSEAPRIAGGAVRVLLHVLGPNFRPVQITDDLRSFWSTTYHQVRKELRGRYPKHSWPEDPWNASPEARGGRRAP